MNQFGRSALTCSIYTKSFKIYPPPFGYFMTTVIHSLSDLILIDAFVARGDDPAGTIATLLSRAPL